MPSVQTPFQPLKVLMVSSEAVPYAKTGGLADVAGALPQELVRLGHDVRLVIPHYQSIDGTAGSFTEFGRLKVPIAGGTIETIVEESRILLDGEPSTGRVLTIRHDPFFHRSGLYQESGRDYPDNLQRFSFFCRAVIELVGFLHERQRWVPDVLHLHDSQTALCAVYAKTLYAKRREFSRLRILMTLHNIGYQGIFPEAQYVHTGLPPDLFTSAAVEFYGSLNLLKGGILFADALTTVSPTYSREVQTAEFGFGLEGVLAERKDRFFGVVNGIDTHTWNPATDLLIPCRYSLSDLAGKQICKEELQRELKLPVKKAPLLGVVSRLTSQKGLDLVADAILELMVLDLQLAILGVGDAELESQFRSLHARHPDKLSFTMGFDEGLAHRIQAGADMILMPSRYEPCGLSQLYGLRYGTVPIVRRTGGLADTVVSYSPGAIRDGRATGFLFEEASTLSLLTAVSLARFVYKEQEEWHRLITAGMNTDVSWTKSAQAYIEIYDQLLSRL